MAKNRQEMCKLWGHQWDPLGGPPLGYSTSIPGYAEWLRCEQCSTVRLLVISYTTGYVSYSRYIYPDGYQWKGNIGEAPSKAELRRDYALAKEAAKVTPLKTVQAS